MSVRPQIEDVVRSWPTSVVVMALAALTSSMLLPTSHTILFLEWPDGNGGKFSFRRDNLDRWHAAAIAELDRRLPLAGE